MVQWVQRAMHGAVSERAMRGAVGAEGHAWCSGCSG